MNLILPIHNLLFLDKNICIKIRDAVYNNTSYSNLPDILKYLKDKNDRDTFVFTFTHLLEGGHRKADRDYDENILETLDDSECIKKFFDKSIFDVNAFKQAEEYRKKLGIGQLDFQFDQHIIFYKSLREIIYCNNKNRKRHNKEEAQVNIIKKAKECKLKLYYPIVVSSIAVLYQGQNNNIAETFLKLQKQITDDKKDKLYKNVANDMVNILRFSSTSYKFIFDYLKNEPYIRNIEFVTEDKYLDKFIKHSNIKSLYYLIKGKPDGSCPIERSYFTNSSDEEWAFLQTLFSTI